MTDKKRVVILISGRGSNMNALIEATKEEDYPAQIVGVISNKEDAPGLELAKAANIPTLVVPPKDTGDRAIDQQLRAWNADIVCLAGFLRILSAPFCKLWHGKIINIHPSLLPEFKGLNTHSRALEAEATEHGCTAHFVVAELDGGPIIGQVAVPVLYDDNATILAERVLKAEHKLYPWALAQIASGDISFNKLS